MGLLGELLSKSVTTAARNATIRTVGDVTKEVIAVTAQNRVPKDDAVVKKGKLYIRPTRPSENYYNEDVLEITTELLGAGFESVTIKPVKKLNERAAKKYGKIQSIKINGFEEFPRILRVPASAQIIIEYLEFKDGVSMSAYATVKRIKPGTIYGAKDIECLEQKNNVPVLGKVKGFCVYCGEPIKKEGARFCASCGKPI